MAVKNDYADELYASGAYGGLGYWDGGYGDSNYWDPTRKYEPKPITLPLTPGGGGEAREREDNSGGPDDPGVWADQYTRGLAAPSLENSFGWADVPMGMRAAFNVPGAGLIGGMIKAGASVANNASLNKTREALGLPTSGFLSGAWDANLGTIGTVTIGDQTYTVSANPNPKDPNMISPAEAQQIAAATGHTIEVATKEQEKARAAQMKELGTTPSTISNKGALGSVAKQAATSVMNELVGKTTKATQAVDKAMPTSRNAPTQSVQRSNLSSPTQVASLDPSIGLGAPPSASVDFARPDNVSFSTNSLGVPDDGSYQSPMRGITDRVTSEFGNRSAPNTGGGKRGSSNHRGMDFAMNPGLIDGEKNYGARSAQSGVVSFAGSKPGFGNTVEISHPDGNTTRYGHLDSINVEVGQEVGKGHPVGVTGNTGNSSGTHLHFEVLDKDGVSINPRGLIDDFSAGIATPTSRADAIASLPEEPEETPFGGWAQTTPSNPGPMTPSEFSAMGLGAQYSPQEQQAIATTLAGELSPETLHGIAVGDPQAMMEAASVIGTIDNRAMNNKGINAENKYGALQGVLTPDQYNALDPTVGAKGFSNLDTTVDNYKAYKDDLDQVVGSYFAGDLPSSTPEATHYANLDIADPAWGKDLDTKVGDHTFGTPDQSWAAAQDAYGTAFGPASGANIGPETMGQSFADPNNVDSRMSQNMLDDNAALAAGGGFVDPSGMSSVEKAEQAAAEQSAKAKGEDEQSKQDAADKAESESSDSDKDDNDNDTAGGFGSSSLF